MAKPCPDDSAQHHRSPRLANSHPSNLLASALKISHDSTQTVVILTLTLSSAKGKGKNLLLHFHGSGWNQVHVWPGSTRPILAFAPSPRAMRSLKEA